MAVRVKHAWTCSTRWMVNSEEHVLSVLESCDGIKQFNQVHTQLIIHGLFQHSLVASRAIKKLCSHPRTTPRAAFLFDHLHHPDAFFCNTIIRSYLRSSNSSAAFSFYYHKMFARWVPPNHYTFPLILKLCADSGYQREGEKAHARVVKFGFEFNLFARNSLIRMYSVFGRINDAWLLFESSYVLDLVSYNTMIDGYVKIGQIGGARKLFDEMPDRDVFSWNCMIAGHVSVGDLDAAKELFETMPDRDVVSWNCMIDGCIRVGNVSLALEFFNRMDGGIRNVVSWNSLLALHVRVKNFGECLRMFERMMESGEAMPNEATLDVLLGTCLLTMYAKCGAMDFARDVFVEMPVKSIVSWNSMIMGYGLHGNGDKALEMFEEMEKADQKPNDATFVCVLSACSHAGMVMEGWWYFDLMRRVYKIEPKVEHYGCMVDLLARAGFVKNSEELIEKVSVKGGSALWGALLSGCRTHLDLELAENVAKRLAELEPLDISPYIVLSDIYGAQGRWDDVERVRLMMKEKGLRKEAASSLVYLEDSESKSIVNK
ncbi:unnamed protein product [Lathyrus oleraceus]